MTLLDAVIFLPFIGFLVLLFVPRSNPGLSRTVALAISVIIFLASLGLVGPFWFAQPSGFAFVTDTQWISTPPIRYHVGLDGLSLWLVLLTTLLTPICVLISWNSIDKRVKEYFAFLILLEFGLIGVFVALDLFLFYVFWEVSLVPMYFLIGIWGHDRRIYAAVKFFLYTMVGLSADAGCDDLSVQSIRHVRLRHAAVDDVQRTSQPDLGGTAPLVPGLLRSFRHEGSDLPAAHVAA